MDFLIKSLYLLSLIWLIFEGKKFFLFNFIKSTFESMSKHFHKQDKDPDLILHYEYVNNICNGNVYNVETTMKITKILMLFFIVLGFLISWIVVLFNFVLLGILLYIANKQADNYLVVFNKKINEIMQDNNY